MDRSASPLTPAINDPDHIERSLANQNELMRQTFAAMGLDRQIRTTEQRPHDAREYLPYGVQPIRMESGYRFFGSGW